MGAAITHNLKLQLADHQYCLNCWNNINSIVYLTHMPYLQQQISFNPHIRIVDPFARDLDDKNPTPKCKFQTNPYQNLLRIYFLKNFSHFTAKHVTPIDYFCLRSLSVKVLNNSLSPFICHRSPRNR